MLKLLTLLLLPVLSFAESSFVSSGKTFTFRLIIEPCTDKSYEQTLRNQLVRKFTTIGAEINYLEYICNECFPDDHDETNYDVILRETDEGTIEMSILDRGSKGYDKIVDYPAYRNPSTLATSIAADVYVFFSDLLNSFLPPTTTSVDPWLSIKYKRLITDLEQKFQKVEDDPDYFEQPNKKEAIIEFLKKEEAEQFDKEYDRLERIKREIIQELNSANPSVLIYLELNVEYRIELLKYAIHKKMPNFRDKFKNNRRLESIKSDLQKLTPSKKVDYLLDELEDLITTNHANAKP